tara:strand:- start:635 stop:862 length:228 start_codon:yes stop_codon:yes gene_type:complete
MIYQKILFVIKTEIYYLILNWCDRENCEEIEKGFFELYLHDLSKVDMQFSELRSEVKSQKQFEELTYSVVWVAKA